MVTRDKPMPTTRPPDGRGTAGSSLPSCVFCGRSMATLDTVAGVPIHPDCFTRMCISAMAEGMPRWRWIPYQGWIFS